MIYIRRDLLITKLALTSVVLIVLISPASANLIAQGSFDPPMFSMGEFITSNSESLGISSWTVMVPDAGNSGERIPWLDLNTQSSALESAGALANAATTVQAANNFAEWTILPWPPPASSFTATSSSTLLELSNSGLPDNFGGPDTADLQPSAETPEPAAFVIGALALLAAKILRRRE